MKKTLLNGIAALALLTSFGSHASFVNSDLNAGDGLTVTDTVTGNVWLDLSQTAGMSIGYVNSQMNASFSGWRLATSAEVLDMFNRLLNLNLTTTYTYLNPVQSSLFTTFTGMFGITQAGSTNWAMGLFLHEGNVTRNGLHKSTSTRLTNFLNVSADLNAGGPSDGVYLIRDTTPVISDVTFGGVGALTLLGLAGLARRRRMPR